MKRILIGVILIFTSHSIFAASPEHQESFLNKSVKKITRLPASHTKIASYSCQETDVQVQYFFVGDTAAAMVPIQGEKTLFVSILAGSGVKYVSGPYVWWSKGNTAFLEDSSTLPNKLVYSDCEQQF